MQLLTPADYRDMPWKNGGGTTRELYRLPYPSDPAGFALRLSIARVEQGGPFSAFPGIDRTLLLLDGDGVALRFADGPETRLDRLLQPVEFAGEIPVACRLLGGPVRDFNAMVARDWGRLALHAVDVAAGGRLALGGTSAVLAYLHRGSWRGEQAAPQSGSLLVLAAGETCELVCEDGGCAIVATLDMLAP
ncbi:HutD family protein [Chitinivorax sp. PXF-14]|uniref:HutD/Ves family protein n=1 Tax=Chitinivorax sp. PXF-14 TaxID=3230488 RepID=UPI003464F0D0